MRLHRPSSKLLLIIASLVVIITVWGLLMPLPHHRMRQQRCLVWLQNTYCFAMTADGADTVYFNGLRSDTLLSGVSIRRSEALVTRHGTGFWYSPWLLLHHCGGRIMTTSRLALPDTLLDRVDSLIDTLLVRQTALADRQLADLTKSEDHLDYYVKTHSVTDEGYNQVAQYEQQLRQQLKETKILAQTLKHLSRQDHVKLLYLPRYTYRAADRSDTLSTEARPCHLFKPLRQRGLCILQSDTKLNTLGSVSLARPLFTLVRFASSDDPAGVTLMGFNHPLPHGQVTSAFTAGSYKGQAWKDSDFPQSRRYHTDLPILSSAEGSPIVDRRGVLIGVATKQGLIPMP